MTDLASVLGHEVDALIQTHIITLISTKPLTLRGEPLGKRKIIFPYCSV
jgi:hypothetical protein